MKKIIAFTIVILGLVHFNQSVAQNTFQKTFNETFGVVSTNQTIGGGLIICGRSSRFPATGLDILLMKSDAMGDTLWTRAIGGSDVDESAFSAQTNDRGFIVAGHTSSFGTGMQDAYLVKTDSFGNHLWSKTYGGIDFESINAAQITMDGGYILTGTSLSFDAVDGRTVYLIRTDPNGDTLWTRTYGGIFGSQSLDIIQTSDSGFAIAGQIDVSGTNILDVLLMRIDADGNLLWTKSYGGSENDYGASLINTNDGGFLITGSTKSFDPLSNDDDLYLIKTNANGDLMWSRTYGGGGYDVGSSVVQTTDGGYIAGGITESFGAGARDVYVLKTDANGNLLWSKAFGGAMMDQGVDVIACNDNGILMSGLSNSFGISSNGIYLVKMDSLGSSGCNETTAATVTTAVSTQVGNPTFGMGMPHTIVTNASPTINRGCIVNPLCTSLAIGEMSENASVITYPNPFSTIVHFDFVLTKPAEVRLEVFNISGQKAYSFAPKIFPVGEQQLDWKVDAALSPGIYLAKLQIGKTLTVKKLMKVE